MSTVTRMPDGENKFVISADSALFRFNEGVSSEEFGFPQKRVCLVSVENHSTCAQVWAADDWLGAAHLVSRFPLGVVYIACEKEEPVALVIDFKRDAVTLVDIVGAGLVIVFKEQPL